MAGKHYFDGKNYYVDTMFLNSIRGALPGFELRHMGMGECNYEKMGSSDSIDFDRMRGKKFPGMSGRSHQVYDTARGKLVKKLIAAMEKKGKSTLVKEDAEYSETLMEARKLAGITPKYHENLISDLDD